MSAYWTIQSRPLALIPPGAGVGIRVREIGRGKYSVALRGRRGFFQDVVFLVSWRAAREKGIMAALSDLSPHIPSVVRVGKLRAGRATFILYRAPFYSQRLSRKNRRIARALQDCARKLDKDKRFYQKPGKVLWPYAAPALMAAIRTCAAQGRVPLSVLHALDLILKKTRRGSYFLEFQDQNLGQDPGGELVLLDVVGTVDVDSPERSVDDLIFIEGL